MIIMNRNDNIKDERSKLVGSLLKRFEKLWYSHDFSFKIQTIEAFQNTFEKNKIGQIINMT